MIALKKEYINYCININEDNLKITRKNDRICM